MNIWLAEIWRAWRASLRRPGFLLLAGCVLGLGVGASATVFTLVDQTLLRPLPFPQSRQLTVVGMDFGGMVLSSPREYQHLKSMQGVVSTGLVEMASRAVNVFGGGTPARARALHFDRHLLPTLGLHMALGRNFTASEDRPHGPPVVMLSHAFWERDFGGDPGAIGKALMVKGTPYTIIGVLPAAFDEFCRRFRGSCDIALPTVLAPNSVSPAPIYVTIARLAPGTTISVAQAQVNARMHQLAASSSDSILKHQAFDVTNLDTALYARSRLWFTLFMASALFLLLIAWVNLTNLLFLRTLARHHERAVREALGASFVRRHLPAFAESILVALCGTALGIGLAVAGVNLFGHFASSLMLTLIHVPAGSLHLGVPTAWFALAVAVVAALSATALGGWKARRLDLGSELHEGGRSGANPRLGHLGRALVVVQIALATVLLSGSGLFLHAMVDASQVRLGFNPQGVLTFQLTPVKYHYADKKAVLALGTRIVRRLEAQPGVVHAAMSLVFPGFGYRAQRSFRVGRNGTFTADVAGVGAHYFMTYAIPVIKGRAFKRTDASGGERIAVVNERFARKHFDGHALGKVLNATSAKSAPLRIVGVVGNVGTAPHGGSSRPPQPAVYMPMQQLRAAPQLSFALRVRGGPNDYRATVIAVMAGVAPMQPIGNVRTLQSILAQRLSPVHFVLLLTGLFAVLALLLAAAGIYAVMAVVVAAREHEFGVRTALGASPMHLIRRVLRDGMLQVVIGLIVGIGAAIALSGTLHALLTDIGRGGRFDPWDIAGVCVLLALSGLFACLRPALRAGHVQPMHALRGE